MGNGGEPAIMCFHRWFRAFGEEEQQRLEVPGRDLLRCLLWHASGIDDPRIDEALFWFSKAQWKTQKSKSYTGKLVGPYVLALANRPPHLAQTCLKALVEKGDITPTSKYFDVASFGN